VTSALECLKQIVITLVSDRCINDHDCDVTGFVNLCQEIGNIRGLNQPVIGEQNRC
jgi:hypothetical protein